MIAVLLGIPCAFIGLYGIVGVVTGQKLIAGSLGTVWCYLAVTGAYELNRRRFDWKRGREHRDQHLFAGTLAVSSGMVISGAMQESMPALALVSAVSAIMQANDGHDGKLRSRVHSLVLIAGIVGGAWLYNNGAVGRVLLARVAALP